ncbi:uncharacterized protein [Pyrus communis]|uniref:uncharacterized protein n=1 Tax=Pyrus communis TaxID=23211 RepID=UPI0035C0052C
MKGRFKTSSTSQSKKIKKTKSSRKMSLLHHHSSKTGDEIDEYYQLLLEYKDVLAWTYKEMPGLDPIIAVHRLAVKLGMRPIKQTQRRYRSKLIPQIEVEIDKLIEAGFIREVQYPKWISNIVIVIKKSGQICVCVDFWDLNDAC